MSALMKKHPIKKVREAIRMQHAGVVYQFPKQVAEKYRITDKLVSSDIVFAKLNETFTKAGALLRGVRLREGLTQIQMAKKMKMTQSDVSQMERGTRKIGRKVAQRIEKLFDVDYRSFLE